MSPFLIAHPSESTNVTLNWDANEEEDLAGYYLYYGSDSDTVLVDGTKLDLGNVVTYGLLQPSGTVYYYLAAYDTEGNESPAAGPVEITI